MCDDLDWLPIRMEGQPEMAATVEVNDSGRPTVSRLFVGALGPTTITARTLRDIRIGEIIDQAVRAGAVSIPTAEVTDYTAPKGRPPREYPDEHYRWIAAQYRRALVMSPRSPTKRLREMIPDRSDATIRRWVQRARDKGYLGQAVPGKGAA